MTNKTEPLSDELHAYLVAHGSTPDPVAADLLAETRASLPHMVGYSIAPEQAGFFTLLTRITGARHAVEVGTFTGFSALAIARGLPADGKLVCCDVSAEYTAIARRHWERAGLADRIELRLGPAAETLRGMPAEPHIDLAFIDADKGGYPTYWAELVPRVRPGGLILIDNVLRHGRVIAPRPDNPDDATMIDFNDRVRRDERTDAVMIPIGDGLTIARKR